MMRTVLFALLVVGVSAFVPRSALKAPAATRLSAVREPESIVRITAVALPTLVTTALPVLAADDPDPENPILTAIKALLLGGTCLYLGIVQPWRDTTGLEKGLERLRNLPDPQDD